MFYAMAEVIAEKGYAATSVAAVVARAQVSRRTFYEQFRSREECFAAAFEYAVDTVTVMMADSVADTPRQDWRALLRTTLRTYLGALVQESLIARVLHVECLAVDFAVAEQRRDMKTRLAQRMQAVFAIGRDTGDIPSDIPAAAFELLIGGIDDRIRDCIQFQGPDALAELDDEFYRTTVALFGVPEW